MATSTPEIKAAGPPAKKAAPQAKKRKADEVEDAAPASQPPKAKKTKKTVTDSAAGTPAQGAETTPGEVGADAPAKPASRASKRKRADHDNTARAASPKKMKKDAKPAAKPRQPRRTKKAAAAVEPLPQPPSPVKVTFPVQHKIDAVKRFLNVEMVHEDSKLKRDADNTRLITIPELDLLGVVMTLYFHWQMGSAETEASVSDLAEAIKSTLKAPIGTYGDVDWMVVDLDIPTALEQRIKEKIAHHGLEDVSLLEVEMELCARRNIIRAGLYRWEAERIMRTGDFLRELVEDRWYGQGPIQRQTDALRMRGLDEKEIEKRGVCPAPVVEIV